ncbi:MAG: fumarylacetoacetate hydrolase family protein [Halobacteriaceae archaeon]
MKRVRFRDPAGSVRYGEWNDETVSFGDVTYAKKDVDILAPSSPSKVVCVGLNYADHAEESGMDIPERPLLFLKPPSAIAGHGDEVTLPKDKERLEFEAELGVLIGKQCRHVDRDDAMDVVEGFTCVNDLSNRDDQYREQNWVRGKAFDGAAPVGPCVAPPSDVSKSAGIQLRHNGELRQSSSRDNLIFTVPELIEEITTYLTLEPGDIIATGTPAGVGSLSDGDAIEITIEGVGTLKHTVHIP